MKSTTCSLLADLNFPKPNDENFVAKVLAEIAQANKRAWLSLTGEDIFKEVRARVKREKSNAHIKKSKPSPRRSPLVKPKMQMNGTCIRCGGHYNKYTNGCEACMNRHRARRRNRRQKTK